MPLKSFLLGELSHGERGEVEERLFADPEYFRQFRAAEDELMDEYLYGDLDAGERERFETYFLNTPERRESLRVARALKQYISRNAAPASALANRARVTRKEQSSFFDFLRLPALRFSLSTAAVLIVAAGLWWLLVRPPTRDKTDPALQANSSDPLPTPTQLARATPGQENLPPVVPPTPAGNVNGNVNRDGGVRHPKQPRHTPSRLYSFLILPLGQVRDNGDENEVILPANAGVVRLRIPLVTDPGLGRYRVTLQTDAGEDIKSWPNLKPAKGEMGKTVSVKVPASTLTQQNYRLLLAAANGDTISTRHFKVTRQK